MRRDDEGRSDDEPVGQTANPSSDGLNSTNNEAPPIQLLVRVGDNLPRVTPPGYAVATDLLAELLDGIDRPHAFAPPDRHTGLCRICGATATLTFEHIPPSSAGNDRRARSSPGLPLLTSDQPLNFPKTGWTPAQRGVGGYVLCKPCNEFVGQRYILEYGQLAAALRKQVDGAFAALGHAVGGLDLDLAGWALGDVARAGLVTVMDVAVHDRLLRRYPELTNVVRQPGTPLPSTLRLGLTVVLGTRARLSSPVCQADPDGCVVFSEAALAPFSWTLSFLEPGLRSLPHTADVSEWLHHGQNHRPIHAQLKLPVGAVVSPTPGDYRPASLIEANLPTDR
ncbi:hypothetical protein SAMN05660464_4465 [Geodermatophilus dictyosporus]|uniref:Uncharacterized protein n=1 Tax=Geodermatophilus dictyosporus TaxID=1523247 RepID=A0A1I5TR00_9ACTN|nr:hypothetical protein [Geodermatophilus dictyosporus]SFP85465.1 hypothetical protein SAMN05660464_4465 [Geodermatophilus dictyosporus]